MLALVGIIPTTLSMTGLGVKLASGIEIISGGSLLVAMLLVYGISILIGMGGCL
jgi:TRAP-type uncharacterized transport system fused permease subunit